MKRSLKEPVNPFDRKAHIAWEAHEFWKKVGNVRMSQRMLDLWNIMITKGTEWEIGMAQVRLEILDAVDAYERRAR